MKVSDYGIEIDFIDNTDGSLEALSGGFMTNNLYTMADFCEKIAQKLRDKAMEEW